MIFKKIPRPSSSPCCCRRFTRTSGSNNELVKVGVVLLSLQMPVSNPTYIFADGIVKVNASMHYPKWKDESILFTSS